MPSYQIYLINLDRSTDRLAAFCAQAAPLGLEFIRISAVEGALEFPQGTTEHRYYRPLAPSEMGCYSSHVKTLRAFLASEFEYAVILEDDCILHDTTLQFIEESLDGEIVWDVLKLQGKKKGLMLCQALPSTNIVAYSSVPLSTRGAIWSRAGAHKMLRHFEQHGIARPVDVDMRFTWENELRILVLNPPAVTKGKNLATTIGDRRASYKQRKRASNVLQKWKYEAGFVSKNLASLVKQYGLVRAVKSQLGVDEKLPSSVE